MSLKEISGQGLSPAALRARVLDAMRRASAAGVLHGQAVARRAGLAPADMECLDLILTGGPTTPGRIGERTGLTSGAVTALLDRLERGGFVRRRPDPSDRRRVLVEAVPERLAPLAALFAPLQAAMEAILDREDAAFLWRMADLLDRAEAATRERTRALNRGGD
jgi:DNA-binding MarR family transcriptional regulator